MSVHFYVQQQLTAVPVSQRVARSRPAFLCVAFHCVATNRATNARRQPTCVPSNNGARPLWPNVSGPFGPIPRVPPRRLMSLPPAKNPTNPTAERSDAGRSPNLRRPGAAGHPTTKPTVAKSHLTAPSLITHPLGPHILRAIATVRDPRNHPRSRAATWLIRGWSPSWQRSTTTAPGTTGPASTCWRRVPVEGRCSTSARWRTGAPSCSTAWTGGA
jgi:hypothetical protein